MRAYRVVDRLYPTPCVGLNTLRISDAICPRETDASEMRGNTMWEGYKKFALPLPSIRELQD